MSRIFRNQLVLTNKLPVKIRAGLVEIFRVSPTGRFGDPGRPVLPLAAIVRTFVALAAESSGRPCSTGSFVDHYAQHCGPPEDLLARLECHCVGLMIATRYRSPECAFIRIADLFFLTLYCCVSRGAGTCSSPVITDRRRNMVHRRFRQFLMVVPIALLVIVGMPTSAAA